MAWIETGQWEVEVRMQAVVEALREEWKDWSSKPLAWRDLKAFWKREVESGVSSQLAEAVSVSRRCCPWIALMRPMLVGGCSAAVLYSARTMLMGSAELLLEVVVVELLLVFAGGPAAWKLVIQALEEVLVVLMGVRQEPSEVRLEAVAERLVILIPQNPRGRESCYLYLCPLHLRSFVASVCLQQADPLIADLLLKLQLPLHWYHYYS